MKEMRKIWNREFNRSSKLIAKLKDRLVLKLNCLQKMLEGLEAVEEEASLTAMKSSKA